mgnify:CR=1 FL=1
MKISVMMAVALSVSAAFTVMAQNASAIESITITPTSAKLAVGGSRTYKAEILPADAASGAKVEWSSSEPRVATIDANGKVRGMAPGITVLKATCGEMSADLTLTVSLKAPKVGYYLFSDGTWEQGAVVAGKTCVGMIFYVNADGRTGKAVSLDEAEQLSWSGATMAIPAANDVMNGAANCAAIANVPGWESGFQAANWCASKSDDNLKWYLPAVDEMRQLFAASCGLTWVEKDADTSKGQVNNWTGNSVTMAYKDGQPDTNPYPEARATFNANLAKAGGAALAADKYWTSTMMSADLVNFLSFEGGYSNGQPKQYFHVCRTRAITSFPDPEPIVPVPTSVHDMKAHGSALEVFVSGGVATVGSQKPIQSLAVAAMTGAMVEVNAAIDANKATFSTAALPQGVYVVTVVSADGSKASAKMLKR